MKVEVNKLRQKQALQLYKRSKIDAHRGGYQEPLGPEHLYQQGIKEKICKERATGKINV